MYCKLRVKTGVLTIDCDYIYGNKCQLQGSLVLLRKDMLSSGFVSVDLLVYSHSSRHFLMILTLGKSHNSMRHHAFFLFCVLLRRHLPSCLRSFPFLFSRFALGGFVLSLFTFVFGFWLVCSCVGPVGSSSLFVCLAFGLFFVFWPFVFHCVLVNVFLCSFSFCPFLCWLLCSFGVVSSVSPPVGLVLLAGPVLAIWWPFFSPFVYRFSLATARVPAAFSRGSFFLSPGSCVRWFRFPGVSLCVSLPVVGCVVERRGFSMFGAARWGVGACCFLVGSCERVVPFSVPGGLASLAGRLVASRSSL